MASMTPASASILRCPACLSHSSLSYEDLVMTLGPPWNRSILCLLHCIHGGQRFILSSHSEYSRVTSWSLRTSVHYTSTNHLYHLVHEGSTASYRPVPALWLCLVSGEVCPPRRGTVECCGPLRSLLSRWSADCVTCLCSSSSISRMCDVVCCCIRTILQAKVSFFSELLVSSRWS